MKRRTRNLLLAAALSGVVVMAILEGCNRWLAGSPYRVLVGSLLIFGVVLIQAPFMARLLRDHEPGADS